MKSKSPTGGRSHGTGPGPAPVEKPSAKRKKAPFRFVLAAKELYRRLRYGRNYLPPNAVTHDLAVKQFLGNIMGLTARMYPGWIKIINDAFAEHNSADARQVSLDAEYPLDDFFFAGFVALEAARIPALFPPAEADVLFSTIADQLDIVANRRDRLVSDLFFEIIARLNLLAASASEQRPYDKVVKVILKRLAFDQSDAGRLLLADKAFRQLLAEPFALYAPQWWERFKTQFVLHVPIQDDSVEKEAQDALAALIAKTEANRKQPKRRWRRKAESIFEA